MAGALLGARKRPLPAAPAPQDSGEGEALCFSHEELGLHLEPARGLVCQTPLGSQGRLGKDLGPHAGLEFEGPRVRHMWRREEIHVSGFTPWGPLGDAACPAELLSA